MICQKLTQCIDYLSDPINGETNCCFCCLKIKPMSILKAVAVQDMLISIGLILVGINSIVKLNIFDLYLKSLSSNTLMYGIIFAASGGLLLLTIVAYYLGNRKRNLKCFGLFYVIYRAVLFVVLCVYSILLLLCSFDKNNLNDPIYGFNAATKLQIQTLSGAEYGVLGAIIAFTLFNHFFSFILFLAHRFISNEYEYERRINMQQVEEKQTFAPEWFRNQDIVLRNKNNNAEQINNKNNAAQNIASNTQLSDIEKAKQTETLPTNNKKSKFNRNKVVPLKPSEHNSDEDLRAKSTKLIIPDDNDSRGIKSNVKVIDLDGEESDTSFNNQNRKD